MTMQGEEVLDLKGIVQGSPHEEERCQELMEMP